jgi:hypothetical protein
MNDDRGKVYISGREGTIRSQNKLRKTGRKGKITWQAEKGEV